MYKVVVVFCKHILKMSVEQLCCCSKVSSSPHNHCCFKLSQMIIHLVKMCILHSVFEYRITVVKSIENRNYIFLNARNNIAADFMGIFF